MQATIPPPTSPFKAAEVVVKVSLEPQKSGGVMIAVKEKLNNILFKYNEDVQGVPILYDELSFVPGKHYARIFGEYPWLHVDVRTTFLVFQPTVGQLLKGQVNKVRK
jgi:hypothetical protein